MFTQPGLASLVPGVVGGVAGGAAVGAVAPRNKVALAVALGTLVSALLLTFLLRHGPSHGARPMLLWYWPMWLPLSFATGGFLSRKVWRVATRDIVMPFLVGFVFVASSVPVCAANLSPVEAAKIEYLITSVAELQRAQFIRNGTAHDAASAASHLRRKLKAAGSRVKTADDFIRLCASASSMTGAPYRIRFSDGREIDARDYFRQKLDEYPAAQTDVVREPRYLGTPDP
jgi:hypothetical protein